MITLQQLANNTPQDVRQRSKEVNAIIQQVTLGEKTSGKIKIATIVFTGTGKAAAEESWWNYTIELYPTEVHANIFSKVGMNNLAWVKCSCFTGDTLIPLANGKSVPIKDLVGLKKFFVYSKDIETGKMVIGKAHTCELKEKNAEIIEVEFDNGAKIKCTPDHEFLLIDGKTYREAKDLSCGDSLSALYRRLGTAWGIKNYEQVLQDNEYKFTHLMADEYNLENKIYKKEDGTVRHKDFNKYNNTPDNLERLFKDGISCSQFKRTTKGFTNEARNHKVVSVRKITEREDVYCFTVDKYANFVIDLEGGKDLSSGVVVHNCPFFHFYLKYAVWKKDSTSITTSRDKGALKAAFIKNPGSLAYLCKHLYKAHLEVVNRAQQLAKQQERKSDIKFTR